MKTIENNNYYKNGLFGFWTKTMVRTSNDCNSGSNRATEIRKWYFKRPDSYLSHGMQYIGVAHPEKKIARHWKFKVWNFSCENVFIYFFGHEKSVGFTWNWQDSCKI